MNLPEQSNNKKIQLDETPNGEDELEDFTTEQEQARAAVDTLKIANEQLRKEILQRESFAKGAFRITLIWVLFLMMVTVFQIYHDGALSEHNFTVVFTSTTVSVLGFWGLVGRYLFHRPK